MILSWTEVVNEQEAVMYEERPSRVLDAFVWKRTVASQAVTRILPDGCLDLIWVDGRLLVAGPDTTAHVATDTPGASYWGVRFAPGTGPSVLGVPAHELRDQRVDLADLWPESTVRELAERISAAQDPWTGIEELAQEHLRETDPAITGIADQLREGASVAAVSARVGWSERHLLRLSLHAFGYGPKTLARILRLNRALALARAGIPPATVAVTAGYTDQAHLSHEVKALSGVPLKSLL